MQTENWMIDSNSDNIMCDLYWQHVSSRTECTSNSKLAQITHQNFPTEFRERDSALLMLHSSHHHCRLSCCSFGIIFLKRQVGNGIQGQKIGANSEKVKWNSEKYQKGNSMELRIRWFSRKYNTSRYPSPQRLWRLVAFPADSGYHKTHVQDEDLEVKQWQENSRRTNQA